VDAQRIVSLTCSNTEIVGALGCLDRLVGVDDYSDFPPEVAEFPRVGPDLGIDVDAVAALAPDLVLASLTVPGHERVVESIAAAGFEYLAPSPQSIDDVYTDIEEIAARLGVASRGREVIESMRKGLAPRPAPSSGRPVVAVQWWPKPPILPGGASWVNDLLARAGAANPLADEPVESRPVPLAELAAFDPDAIVLSWCGVESTKIDAATVLENPALESVRAVRSGRVVTIPEAYLGRPSPRLTLGFRALSGLVESIVSDSEFRRE